MRLLSLTLGVMGLVASLIGTVVAEEGHVRVAAHSSQDLGGRSQRYVVRFAQDTPVTSVGYHLSCSIPTSTLTTSTDWGGRSQRYVAHFAQVTPIPANGAPVSDVRCGEDQAPAATTSLPLCCFNEAKGQYDCPCHKSGSVTVRGSDKVIPPPSPCTPCWQAMQPCNGRCDGDAGCLKDCQCQAYGEIPMCQRCPWAVARCGSSLPGHAVEGREAVGKAMTTAPNNMLDAIIPTTMATIVAVGRQCTCRDCTQYGGCHVRPCPCGSARAFAGEVF